VYSAARGSKKERNQRKERKQTTLNPREGWEDGTPPPHRLIDFSNTKQLYGKAKHSPTNDWDTNAVWVDARQMMTVTQERHTEPQDKTLRDLKKQ